MVATSLIGVASLLGALLVVVVINHAASPARDVAIPVALRPPPPPPAVPITPPVLGNCIPRILPPTFDVNGMTDIELCCTLSPYDLTGYCVSDVVVSASGPVTCYDQYSANSIAWLIPASECLYYNEPCVLPTPIIGVANGSCPLHMEFSLAPAPPPIAPPPPSPPPFPPTPGGPCANSANERVVPRLGRFISPSSVIMYVPFNPSSTFVSALGVIEPLGVPAPISPAPNPTAIRRPLDFADDVNNSYTGSFTNLTQCGTFLHVVLELFLVSIPDSFTGELVRLHLLAPGVNATIVVEYIGSPKRARVTMYNLPGVSQTTMWNSDYLATPPSTPRRERISVAFSSSDDERHPYVSASAFIGSELFIPLMGGYVLPPISCISATVANTPYVDEFAVHTQNANRGFCLRDYQPA